MRKRYSSICSIIGVPTVRAVLRERAFLVPPSGWGSPPDGAKGPSESDIEKHPERHAIGFRADGNLVVRHGFHVEPGGVPHGVERLAPHDRREPRPGPARHADLP